MVIVYINRWIKFFSRDNDTKKSDKEILVNKEDIIISNSKEKEKDKNKSNIKN